MLNCVGCEVGNYGINTSKKVTLKLTFLHLPRKKVIYLEKARLRLPYTSAQYVFFYISKKIKQDNKMAMFWKNKIKKTELQIYGITRYPVPFDQDSI